MHFGCANRWEKTCSQSQFTAAPAPCLASDTSAEQEQAYRAGLSEALDAGYAMLERGAASLDAAIAAVCVLEDNPLFNAGRGAVLTRDGAAELDASVMDGRTLEGAAPSRDSNT